MFDVFQRGWACKAVRYLGIFLPSITMNNLIVISVERFLATRQVPHTFSVYTVRKLVYGAWIAGFIAVLIPAATMTGIEYDLNATHYTVVCKCDNSYLPFRVMFVSYNVLQHFVPILIVSYMNIAVTKTLWSRTDRTIDVQRDNFIKVRMRTAKIRGTYFYYVCFHRS